MKKPQPAKCLDASRPFAEALNDIDSVDLRLVIRACFAGAMKEMNQRPQCCALAKLPTTAKKAFMRIQGLGACLHRTV
jgi:hypothetical protein